MQYAVNVLEAKAKNVFNGETAANGLEIPSPNEPNYEASRFLVVFNIGNRHHKNNVPIKAKIVFYLELRYFGCRTVEYLLSRIIATVSPKAAPNAKMVIDPPLSTQ